MRFVDKNKFTVFDKTFYNNKDIIIIDIVNRVLRLDNLTMKSIITELQIRSNINNI